MECTDIVDSSVVYDVGEKVKSVVHCGSETMKTGNSLEHENVETPNMVQNDSDTIETLTQLRLVIW